MQFHDITWQRIDHVSEALRNLKKKTADLKKERSFHRRVYRLLRRSGNNGDNSSYYKFPSANLIADTCNLQQAQLQKAKGNFVAALELIVGSLRNVASYAGSISKEIIMNVREKGRRCWLFCCRARAGH